MISGRKAKEPLIFRVKSDSSLCQREVSQTWPSLSNLTLTLNNLQCLLSSTMFAFTPNGPSFLNSHISWKILFLEHLILWPPPRCPVTPIYPSHSPQLCPPLLPHTHTLVLTPCESLLQLVYPSVCPSALWGSWEGGQTHDYLCIPRA